MVPSPRRGEKTARALDHSSVDHFEHVLACLGDQAAHVVAALTVLADALERAKQADL